ncbi:hypothetical protein AAMO2058_001138100 [Amorphochlora amoebiformis]
MAFQPPLGRVGDQAKALTFSAAVFGGLLSFGYLVYNRIRVDGEDDYPNSLEATKQLRQLQAENKELKTEVKLLRHKLLAIPKNTTAQSPNRGSDIGTKSFSSPNLSSLSPEESDPQAMTEAALVDMDLPENFWIGYLDEKTDCMYFSNPARGITSWVEPDKTENIIMINYDCALRLVQQYKDGSTFCEGSTMQSPVITASTTPTKPKQ